MAKFPSDLIENDALKVILQSGDIQIGAVELKDGTTDTRAIINDANTARTTTTDVLVTQHVDSAGVVGGIQGNIASDAANAGLPVGVGADAQDPNSMPANVAANDRVWLRSDLGGRLITYESTTLTPTNDGVTVQGNDMSEADSGGQVASLQVKTSSGKLRSIYVYNNNASAQWIQVHNTTSLPADTAVPVFTFQVAAGNAVSIDFPHPYQFSTGCFLSNSSTAATKTIGGADCFMHAWYE